MPLRKVFLLFSIMLIGVFSLTGCNGSGGAAPVPSGSVVIKFANLNAAQVVPAATTSTLTASGSLTVDTTTGAVSGSVLFQPVFAIITSTATTTVPTTTVQVREGATGTNGGIVITLSAPSRDGAWRVPAGTVLTPAQVSSFIGGNLYFDVHTVTHPDGEARGQISAPPPTGVIGFVPGLEGLQEVPPIVTSASGICNLSVNTSTGVISGGLQILPLPSTPITSVKVYEGGWGVNGGVVVTLTGSGSFWSVPTGAVLTPAQVTSFSAGNFYVNVHTVAHPDGEIRGQADNNGGAPIPASLPKLEPFPSD